MRALATLLFVLYASSAWAGTVGGVVVFEGKVPEPKKINPGVDTAICGQQGLVEEGLIVDAKSKGVRSVVVWIDGSKAKSPPESVALDNYRCRYEPHVAVANVGTPVIIKNRDRFLHTTQAQNDKGKPVFNVALPSHDMTREKKFSAPGVYSVHCDVHTWMKAWVVVLNGEIATVSKDDGSFELTDVPPGEHTLKLWHESLGEKSVPIKVDAKQPQKPLRISWSKGDTAKKP